MKLGMKLYMSTGFTNSNYGRACSVHGYITNTLKHLFKVNLITHENLCTKLCTLRRAEIANYLHKVNILMMTQKMKANF